MDARARMAIRVFICLDCNGNYRYYCIFVLQKKEMVLTKNTSSVMKSIKELYRIGTGPSSSHTMGPRKAAEMFLERHPDAASFKVTLYGSLAATGKGHMTDVALSLIHI